MSELNETIKAMFKPFTATASTSGFTHNEVYAVLLNTLDELKQARQHACQPTQEIHPSLRLPQQILP